MYQRRPRSRACRPLPGRGGILRQPGRFKQGSEGHCRNLPGTVHGTLEAVPAPQAGAMPLFRLFPRCGGSGGTRNPDGHRFPGVTHGSGRIQGVPAPAARRKRRRPLGGENGPDALLRGRGDCRQKTLHFPAMAPPCDRRGSRRHLPHARKAV